MTKNDWNQILLSSVPHNQIFCLWGKRSWTKCQIEKLRKDLEKNSKNLKRSLKAVVVPTRAEYIRRHSYEGFFFQQRFQSVYSRQGETVEGMMQKQANQHNSEELRRHTSLFHLENIWSKPLLQLSSGEWQRVILCLTLLQKPDILIAIHGLDGLDTYWQHRTPQILSEHFPQIQTIIFTSDQPLFYPTVKNIALENQEKSLDITLPEKPFDSLIKAFQEYHNLLPYKNAEQPIIEMTDINIRYGKNQILNHVNWIVHPGEKWNIQGHNGAGKSTLLSLINADNPQGYSQSIRIFGAPIAGRSIWERKARIAYFSSDYFQYFNSGDSVEKVIHVHLQTPYLDTPQPPEHLLQSLALYFDLADHWHKPYGLLDKTMRRQVLLLAAYAKSSELLILDEPYHDFDHSRILKNNLFLESTQQAMIQTVLFVTHRMDHMPPFLNRFLEIDQGKAKEITL